MAGAIHLVVVAGGLVFRSLNDGASWSQCTGAALQPNTWVNMLQNGSYLYLTNGVDNIVRYDGSTTLVNYTSLSTPTAPTIAETGLATTGFTYYYKISRANTVGFSIASAASLVVDTSVPRDSWDDSTNFAVITTPNGVATQTRWDYYISENNIDYFYIASVTATNGATSAFKDNGTAILNPAILAPTANTSLGPKVAELTNVGTRMYGVRDTDNPYRIWFSGSGTYAGAFSSAYDGGYINWQTGGKFRPVKVEDYRDGKGTPLATVWCKSADGQGCVLQVSLDTLTVGDISITVPSAYKLPGSRGTPAPMSVVNVLNDYFFYNSQAFYNLGSRAQFLNLLSTDEASANIRPSVKQISQAAEEEISAVYFDARVYFSVPYGADENNYTAVFDTERKAWLPKAFDIGFKKFLRYTDTLGAPRLLCLKPGDSQLSEISSNFTADYGEAFITTLRTGLYQTAKDRFDFQFTEEAEFEMSNPLGQIVVDLLGIERRRGYTTVASKTSDYSDATLTDTGWDTFAWDTTAWDDTSEAVVATAEPSIKKYFTVQKEMNAVEWNITTQDPNARYILRTLQTWGRPTLAGKPRSWRAT